MISEAAVRQALATVIDPELGYNIIDLGLVYRIEISTDPLMPHVEITMTLTTPGCPLAPFFHQQVQEAVAAAAAIKPEDVNVILTFDPPWSPNAVSEDVKLQLGL